MYFVHRNFMTVERHTHQTPEDLQSIKVEDTMCISLLLYCALRKVEELSGESIGLQDVLLEAGAEDAAKTVRLRELEAKTKQQREQLDWVRPACSGMLLFSLLVSKQDSLHSMMRTGHWLKVWIQCTFLVEAMKALVRSLALVWQPALGALRRMRLSGVQLSSFCKF